MRKRLFHLALIAALFVSCEQYYKPDLEVRPGMLVVESHLTNDPNQNYVRLSKTSDFFSTTQEEKVTGARVDLVLMGGSAKRPTEYPVHADENTPGYFTFHDTPIPGKTYKLRIVYQNDVYESEMVDMPPLPKIDSLFTNHILEKSYRTDAIGGPTQIETPEREICIDAPMTPALKYYRFNWRAIIEWVYNPPAHLGPPPPSYYGWRSIYDNGLFNIAGPKQFSISGEVKNHHILSLAYNGQVYLDSATQIASGWIVILDEYGMTKDSYDFHEKLNKQFSAEGSLFDPILTQVYGNIHCKNDDSKIALGFFDLNSYRQYRYFLNLGYNEKSKVIQRRLNRYPIITDEGYVRGFLPDFWETNY